MYVVVHEDQVESIQVVAGKDVRILRVVSETLLYEVWKGNSLRVRRRLEASMKWKSL